MNFEEAEKKCKSSIIDEILKNLYYKYDARKFSETYGLCSKFEKEYLGYGIGLIMEDGFNFQDGGFYYRTRSMSDCDSKSFSKCTIPQLTKLLGQIIAYNKKYDISSAALLYEEEIKRHFAENAEEMEKALGRAQEACRKANNKLENIAKLHEKMADRLKNK